MVRTTRVKRLSKCDFPSRVAGPGLILDLFQVDTKNTEATYSDQYWNVWKSTRKGSKFEYRRQPYLLPTAPEFLRKVEPATV